MTKQGGGRYVAWQFLHICIALVCVLCVSAGMPDAVSAARPLFSVRGLGGGGGLFSPSISPDGKVLIVCCDMGGVYRSLDRGASWTMIPADQQLEAMHLAPPIVYSGKRMYWITNRRHVCFSDDAGQTWTIMPEGHWNKHPKDLAGKNLVQSFALLPGKEDQLLVSTTKGVWRGFNRSWTRVSEKDGGPVCVVGTTALAVVGQGTLLMSADGGVTWNTQGRLPGKAIAFTGTQDADGRSLLLASVDEHGILLSQDMGKTWTVCKQPYENEKRLAIPQGQIQTAYALQGSATATRKLLRTRDGGKTWKNIFHMPPPGEEKGLGANAALSWAQPFARKLLRTQDGDKTWKNIFHVTPPGEERRPGANVAPSWVQTLLYWGYYFTQAGFTYDPSDPDFCVVTTQGDIYATHDGGLSWDQIMTRELPPLEDGVRRFASIGLEVTSCWGYYVDPTDPQREYIGYTDIGFGFSRDSGASWSWSTKGSPWTNTFYDVAFDPSTPGKLYAAASRRHDIPHYMEVSKTFPSHRIHQGGVVVSTDWGKTWSVPYDHKGSFALPAQVCTTVVADSSSSGPPILYAGIYGENEAAGVYISRDDGKTWQQTPTQPGILPNRHVYRLRIHPETGDIYCLITGLRAPSPHFFNPEGGGIWVSSDQGASWRHASSGSLLNRWATAFSFVPGKPKTVFAAAASPQGSVSAGGIYVTHDGGKSWGKALSDEQAYALSKLARYDHWMSVAVHPDTPGLIFAGSTLNGLFFSTNGGKFWRWCREFPFRTVQSISFNPRDTDKIYITTFGAGVWAGSVKEIVFRP